MLLLGISHMRRRWWAREGRQTTVGVRQVRRLLQVLLLLLSMVLLLLLRLLLLLVARATAASCRLLKVGDVGVDDLELPSLLMRAV